MSKISPLTSVYDAFSKSTGVCIDTRKIARGNIFFALKGDNFNGNLYAAQALEKGASFVVVDEQKYALGSDCFLVEDVLTTLQQLANHHRHQLNIPIIGLTGSNGKTTTKELIQAVLSKKYKVSATKGNLNNHIGVPLTLLEMDSSTEIGVVEMGANKPGDIKELCDIAEPTHGLITNIGKAHLEGFGGFEGVIKTKGEMYDYLLKNDRVVFVNKNDERLTQMSSVFKSPVYYLGTESYYTCEYLGSNPYVELKSEKGVVVSTQMIGRYNFENMAAALCIGKYFELEDVKTNEALEEYIPSNNRSQVVNKGGMIFILDAYNANPSSMKSSLMNFMEMEAKKKIVVLGDMLELGDESKKEHLEILDLVKEIGVDKAFFFGEEFMKNAPFQNFEFHDDKNRLLSSFKENEWSDVLVLVKGSRGMKLEELIENI